MSEKSHYSWMIKLYVAIKTKDREEYPMKQESAHRAVLCEKKGMLNIERTMRPHFYKIFHMICNI